MVEVGSLVVIYQGFERLMLLTFWLEDFLALYDLLWKLSFPSLIAVFLRAIGRHWDSFRTVGKLGRNTQKSFWHRLGGEGYPCLIPGFLVVFLRTQLFGGGYLITRSRKRKSLTLFALIPGWVRLRVWTAERKRKDKGGLFLLEWVFSVLCVGWQEDRFLVRNWGEPGKKKGGGIFSLFFLLERSVHILDQKDMKHVLSVEFTWGITLSFWQG